MLTQLQLEGPELEPLLARVRNELGSRARIVHAEKVRSGGVAGFFASERYELTVEVDTSLPRRAVPAHVQELAASPSLPSVTPAVSTPALSTVASTPAASTPAVGPAGRAPAFAAIAGLGDDEPEPRLFTAPAGPPASPARTATAAAHAYAPQAAPAQAAEPVLPHVPAPREELPSVLAAALGGPPAAPPPPPRAAPAGPAELDAAPAAFAPYAAFAGVLDDAFAVPAPTPLPPSSVLDLADRVSADEAEAVDALVSTEGVSFAALLSRLGDDIGSLGDDVSAACTEPIVPLDTVVDVVDLDQPAPVVSDLRPTDTAVVAVRPAAIVLPDVTEQEDPGAELARLGLPSHLRPTGVGEALHTALRASLSRLPTAPPAMNRPGNVLAVVGPLAQALHVARQVAEELGLPVATSVAVATAGAAVPHVAERQVLRGAAEAAERRNTWRRRSNLTVVAVDAPLTARGAAEARELLAALSPTATWGVVEATRKAQDVGSWARAVGGVHALALTELEETSDPAAVLELGIPVSRLGGRPATPRAWATLLTGRLAA